MCTFRINTTSETIYGKKYFRGYKLTALSPDLPTDNQISMIVKKHKVVDDICVICHYEMTDTDDIITTDCNHQFHKQCLMKWNEHKLDCPMCRKGLFDYHPDAKRFIRDNLLLHNVYMLINILGYTLPIKDHIKKYLDERMQTSEIWKQQYQFFLTHVTPKAHKDMYHRVMNAISRNDEIFNTIFNINNLYI